MGAAASWYAWRTLQQILAIAASPLPEGAALAQSLPEGALAVTQFVLRRELSAATFNRFANRRQRASAEDRAPNANSRDERL